MVGADGIKGRRGASGEHGVKGYHGDVGQPGNNGREGYVTDRDAQRAHPTLLLLLCFQLQRCPWFIWPTSMMVYRSAVRKRSVFLSRVYQAILDDRAAWVLLA